MPLLSALNLARLVQLKLHLLFPLYVSIVVTLFSSCGLVSEAIITNWLLLVNTYLLLVLIKGRKAQRAQMFLYSKSLPINK